VIAIFGGCCFHVRNGDVILKKGAYICCIWVGVFSLLIKLPTTPLFDALRDGAALAPEAHRAELVLELGIDSLEHGCILQHIRNDNKADF